MTYARKQRTHTEENLRLMAALGGAVLLAFAAYFAVQGTWGMYGKLVSASLGSTAAERELQSLEGQQQRLNADIERLSSPRGVEGELRQRYGLAKPGEGIIQVVESQPPPVIAASPEGNSILGRVLHALLPW